jgi:hypothetical protein
VSQFEIERRSPYAGGRSFGSVGGYEQVDGKVHFAVDPDHPRNRSIVDLVSGPRDATGRVTFSADLSVLMPSVSAHGNDRLVVELPNRGRRLFVPALNLAAPDAKLEREVAPGDGFLFERGYTIAAIGWQWDVVPDETLLGLDAPLAEREGERLGGETVVEIRPVGPVTTWLLADRVHRPLPAAQRQGGRTRLYVRDYEDGEDELVAPSSWRFARESDSGKIVPSREHVYLETGFVPGRIYHLVYETDRAPIAGTGLLAVRDIAPFLRSRSVDNPTQGDFAAVYAWGISQTGRMLRHFLSLGLNITEAGELAYDGVQPHIAGGRRGAFNHRFAQPSNQTIPLWGHQFPFADRASHDPLTNATGGLMDMQSDLGGVPKVVYTNSAAEYWRGDGSLSHVSTDGEHDVDELATSRSYAFASTQHVAGYPGQPRSNAAVGTVARYPLNNIDFRPLMRAAFVTLDRWVSEGVEPPMSRHPRLGDGTAVTRDAVIASFARLPGFEPPDPQRLPFLRTVDPGSDEGTGVGRYPTVEGAFYPALVSAVDDDGNEVAGIRMPDVAVPIATHTGWNTRDPETGAAEQLVPMHGMTLTFAPTRAAREAAGDPRPSIEERYVGRDDYRDQVQAAANALVADGYLLAGDVDYVVGQAMLRYDRAVGRMPTNGP